jgi:Zn-dependent membrane protease YugP
MLLTGTSLLVSAILKGKISRYSKQSLASELPGPELTEKMLQENGFYDVKVTSLSGFLSCHHNPANQTGNLSQSAFQRTKSSPM